MPITCPTCRHTHPNGNRCGSPALRGQQFCFFHHPARRPSGPPGLPAWILLRGLPSPTPKSSRSPSPKSSAASPTARSTSARQLPLRRPPGRKSQPGRPQLQTQSVRKPVPGRGLHGPVRTRRRTRSPHNRLPFQDFDTQGPYPAKEKTLLPQARIRAHLENRQIQRNQDRHHHHAHHDQDQPAQSNSSPPSDSSAHPPQKTPPPSSASAAARPSTRPPRSSRSPAPETPSSAARLADSPLPSRTVSTLANTALPICRESIDRAAVSSDGTSGKPPVSSVDSVRENNPTWYFSHTVPNSGSAIRILSTSSRARIRLHPPDNRTYPSASTAAAT